MVEETIEGFDCKAFVSCKAPSFTISRNMRLRHIIESRTESLGSVLVIIGYQMAVVLF